MALHPYGVLKGRVLDRRVETGSKPRYHVLVRAGKDHFRVAINVKSRLPPSELLYLVDEEFDHPLTGELCDLEEGFTGIPSRPGHLALDYIRGSLFDPARMRPLPHEVDGPDNDLIDAIDALIQRAIADPKATICAYGERWGPAKKRHDRHFGFLPSSGIHDVHMNQGNDSRFSSQDGPWQDGALLFDFPHPGAPHPGAPRHDAPRCRWTAVFLAFQSQAWKTGDRTGRAIGESGSRPSMRCSEPSRSKPRSCHGVTRG